MAHRRGVTDEDERVITEAAPAASSFANSERQTEARFASGPLLVSPHQLTQVRLQAETDVFSDLELSADGIHFVHPGSFEVLLTVEWDPENADGHRFSHTKIPDHHPLHSEAIEAPVLNELSGGRQLLRGNSVFGSDGLSCIQLEVWHDAPEPVEIRRAELVVRRLAT